MLKINPSRRRPQPASAPVVDGLREEIRYLFHGDSQVKGKSFKVMLLKVDKRQRAFSYSELKREAGGQDRLAGGSVWPQYSKWESTVKNKYIGKELPADMGMFDLNTTLFFFEYDVKLSEEDEIIEVLTDDHGEPVSPVQYIEKYSIKDIETLRFEDGRAEFHKVYAAKSQ